MSASRKRERQERDDEDSDSGPKKTLKLRRAHDAVTPPDSSTTIPLSYGSPVQWEDYFGHWPFGMPMDDSLTKKRSRTPSHTPSRSYSQSVRDGEAPAAWTLKHEERMQQAGLFMIDYQRRASITDGCQKLCDELCAKDYSDPPGPSLQPQRLAKMLERVRFRNEARVVRDLTSVLVPSAELLDIDGVSPLRNICEALNAEWTQCDTLCGPRPKPDFVAGVSGSAFTNEETAKLQLSHTSASPNLFPENMYFPFLICEVKANDRPLGAAERHAMHSASLAVRALVQLYRKVSAAEELDGKVLVFSIAHDVSIIKIYGHFARIDGDTLTFFRHRLYIGDIATDLRSESSCRAHKITRAIYDVFFPQHVARVKSALSRMRGSYQLDLVDGPHESTISRSSQDDGRFKKPSFPSTTMLQQENERLHGQILEMFRIQQADDMHQREDRAKEREEEHAEWREEQAKRLAMMEQQFAERNEQMEQQLATQRELIALLRESKTK